MGIYRGVTLNQLANTYRAVCFGKYLGSFTEITQAAVAVDDYRMSNGGKWKDLNFPNRFPKPPEKPKRRFAKPVRNVDEQTRENFYWLSLPETYLELANQGKREQETADSLINKVINPFK